MINNQDEARRCLLCKKPFCSLKGCPVRTSVPECMALYREGRLDEAGKILFDNNPLSAVTSQVCDWKQFCFGHCVLNVKGEPIHWYSVEQEVSERYLFQYKLERDSTDKPWNDGMSLQAGDASSPHGLSVGSVCGKRVAIVGAGPAGIAAAVWLYRSGADIDLYDANPRMGGVLRYGIPAFRLDKKFVDIYEKILDVPGIRFFGGKALGKDILLNDLRRDYDAVLIAAGAEKPALLRIPGEDKPGVVEALHYLKDPGSYALKGKRVIVIGGGNVAMDACRTAVRSGAETWVYYRKTFENMPANPMEVEEAKADGVRFRVFQAPIEVGDGYVIFRDCRNETDPETGKLVTKILDGTDHEVPCDVLMPAISEKPDFGILSGVLWQPNVWGWPVTDESCRMGFQDDSPANVWVAGDFTLGPKTVVEAVGSARAAVDGILSFLK